MFYDADHCFLVSQHQCIVHGLLVVWTQVKILSGSRGPRLPALISFGVPWWWAPSTVVKKRAASQHSQPRRIQLEDGRTQQLSKIAVLMQQQQAPSTSFHCAACLPPSLFIILQACECWEPETMEPADVLGGWCAHFCWSTQLVNCATAWETICEWGTGRVLYTCQQTSLN